MYLYLIIEDGMFYSSLMDLDNNNNTGYLYSAFQGSRRFTRKIYTISTDNKDIIKKSGPHIVKIDTS